MDQLPQFPLWSTFSPQTQRHLVAVWIELVGRRLQTSRALPRGGGDERADAYPADASGADGDGVCPPIDHQTACRAPGEYPAPVPAGRDRRAAGLASTTDLHY